MRKLFYSLMAVFCFAAANAQTQSLQFIYITKDHNTKVNPLVEDIRDRFTQARNDKGSATIFYLANWDNPIVVKLNLPGDNRADMDKIFEALMTKSETSINPSVDIKKISELFDATPMRSRNGINNFTDVELIYYVTPTFWELAYNEQVIASLWFILDLDQPWANGYASMSIFHQDGDGLQPDPKAPFGPKDLCHNYNFQLLTY